MAKDRKVFVTQIPNRRDRVTQAMVPVFNVDPASEHGEIEIIMPAGSSIFNTEEMVKHMRNKLSQYNYVRGDSVICAGDPVIIATAGAILSDMTRDYRLLRWEKLVKRYVPVEVHL